MRGRQRAAAATAAAEEGGLRQPEPRPPPSPAPLVRSAALTPRYRFEAHRMLMCLRLLFS